MADVAESKRPKVPPLESGDHLTQAEFHTRYEANPRLKKAELIEGIVFMPSPVSHLHSWAHGHISGWLAQYAARANGVEMTLTPTLILDDRNEYQPDAILRRIEGPEDFTHASLSPSLPQSYVDADGYLRGAPELVAEVAVSSASVDLHEKIEAYQRNGVSEYLVWQVVDEKLSWWSLVDGEYQPIEPSESGILTSRVLPTLRLDVNALLEGDMNKVLMSSNEE